MKDDIVLPSHVQVADLRATLDSEFESLTQRPSDSAMAFCVNVMVWMTRWARLHGQEELASIAPFAIIDVDAGAQNLLDWACVPFFREALPKELGGKLLATSTPMFEVLEHDTGVIGLMELGKCIMASPLATRPMLVVEPSSGRMFVCPRGMNSDRLTLKIGYQAPSKLDTQWIDKLLNDFHRDYTEYPEGFAHVWHHRPSRTLLRDAEAIVRDALFIFLRNETVDSKFVLREESLSVGRVDISIRNRPDMVALCVLELKALRSRGMPKVAGKGPTEYKHALMDRHARRGVRQVHKYRAASEAVLAFVCMYDGRDQEQCLALEMAEELAKSLDVTMRRFFMHTKTQDDLDD